MSAIIKIAADSRVEFKPTDAGFAYGEGLFETIKCFDGGFCFWGAHWARLTASSAALGFDLPEEGAVLAALREWKAIEGSDVEILKLSLLREGDTSVLYLYGRPALADLPESVRLGVEKDTRVNSASLLTGHKSHNYMENMVLWRRAQAAGYYDYLRLNTEGHLAETCVANIFFIKGGVLHTPALETGVLGGVVRAETLRLAAAENIETCEGEYTLKDLAQAEAVFLTNSVKGIVSVDSVESVFKSRKLEIEQVETLSARLAVAEQNTSVIP
ncbi:MAG: Aminodeoxychorismate lyase [Opitutia bacterium UBA7350]|nr:MAG: Aminodeoxychorismate lyase [Opitutae bacterium UBA7350]